MAPFLINHPVLLNNWMMAREEALARVRAQANADGRAVARFRELLPEAQENARLWRSDHPLQQRKLTELRADLAAIEARTAGGIDGDHPWDDSPTVPAGSTRSPGVTILGSGQVRSAPGWGWDRAAEGMQWFGTSA